MARSILKGNKSIKKEIYNKNWLRRIVCMFNTVVMSYIFLRKYIILNFKEKYLKKTIKMERLLKKIS